MMLANTSIMLHNYLLFVMRIFKIYSLNNIQVYSIISYNYYTVNRLQNLFIL